MLTSLNCPEWPEQPCKSGEVPLPTKKFPNISEFKLSVSIPVAIKSMFVKWPS